MKTLIVGGGPVGLATALALSQAHAGGEITVLEASPREKQINSDRNIALSLASWRFLERIGVKTAELISNHGTEIRTVEVTQQGAFGWLKLDAKELGESALGAAVPYPYLKSALDDAVVARGIHVLWNAEATLVALEGARARVSLATGESLVADCVALADGSKASADSMMPEFKSFERSSGQIAVIARVRATKPTHNVAYERFTSGGALALIPRAADAGVPEWTLVWARDQADAERLLALDDTSFCESINAAFGGAMGALTVASKRTSYQLVWRFVEPRVHGPVVAVGNAAQALHPVAAQGLNLGLRDADDLANALQNNNHRSEQESITSALSRFARSRAIDRVATFGFSGVLAYGFDRGGWLLDAPRGLGLMALQMLPPAKRELLRRMAF
ncbi:MAG: FAD-dependent oxidoreductase [Burkholderiales bacterium]|nr:MAG: FAD-dependent oxidoreductase [Betaproteobacteria bacterium]TAG82949.1 MAG: FAD-dependent oxidoreductase [Burkholderiales bacterium]